MTLDAIRTALAAHARRVVTTSDFPGFRRAAVLLLLFPKDGALSILLTVRTDTVETHKGQISAPGGMCDETDVSFADTALRETEEEMGIPRTEIQILGMIDDIATPSKFIITPVVGYADPLPLWKANPGEVAAVLDVPLTIFGDRENIRREERTFAGVSGIVWYFPFQEHIVWGATASMIVNLVDIVSRTRGGI